MSIGAPEASGVMLGTGHSLDRAQHRVDVEPTSDAGDDHEDEQDRHADQHTLRPSAAFADVMDGPVTPERAHCRISGHVERGYPLSARI